MGLGALQTLDVSAYEGAEVIVDLNRPLPPGLAGRFGWIFDGGTMEHVFDIRQGMMNTADLLCPGGRVVHFSPVNNYVNHGFVQISPTLFHDYYVENGFDDVRGIMVVHPRSDIYAKRFNVFRYDHETMGGVNSMFCSDDTQLSMLFTARKTPSSTSDRVPMQSYYTRAHDGREILPYQFVVKHDPGVVNVRQITEADPASGAALHEIVHLGFGSGRPPPEIPATPILRE
jgi:hypothetical protein